MKKELICRIKEEANQVVKTKITIRELAKQTNLSKSTIHKDLNYRLKEIDEDLFDEVNKVFLEHLKVRHIRGGISTKEKYSKNRNRYTILVE